MHGWRGGGLSGVGLCGGRVRLGVVSGRGWGGRIGLWLGGIITGVGGWVSARIGRIRW